MATIYTTIDLPSGWHRWVLVRDAAHAAEIAAGRTDCVLFQSKIVTALYLIIPAEAA